MPEARACEEVLLAQALGSAAVKAAQVSLQFLGVGCVLPVGACVRGVGVVVVEVSAAPTAGSPAFFVEVGVVGVLPAVAAPLAPEIVTGQ